MKAKKKQHNNKDMGEDMIQVGDMVRHRDDSTGQPSEVVSTYIGNPDDLKPHLIADCALMKHPNGGRWECETAKLVKVADQNTDQASPDA